MSTPKIPLLNFSQTDTSCDQLTNEMATLVLTPHEILQEQQSGLSSYQLSSTVTASSSATSISPPTAALSSNQTATNKNLALQLAITSTALDDALKKVRALSSMLTAKGKEVSSLQLQQTYSAVEIRKLTQQNLGLQHHLQTTTAEWTKKEKEYQFADEQQTSLIHQLITKEDTQEKYIQELQQNLVNIKAQVVQLQSSLETKTRELQYTRAYLQKYSPQQQVTQATNTANQLKYVGLINQPRNSAPVTTASSATSTISPSRRS